MPNFAAFLSYVMLTAFTPGPNNIMAMTNAGQVGFRKGLRFSVGVFLGSGVVMILCAVFSALLYRFIPTIEPFMFVLGAVYILWLAITIVLDRPHPERQTHFQLNSVFTGAVLQLINPKLIFYGITAFGTFILPHYRSLSMLGVFVLFLAVVCLVSTACWALFGSAFQTLFTRHRQLMNIIMALLLVYCAVTLLLEVIPL